MKIPFPLLVAYASGKLSRPMTKMVRHYLMNDQHDCEIVKAIRFYLRQEEASDKDLLAYLEESRNGFQQLLEEHLKKGGALLL